MELAIKGGQIIKLADNEITELSNSFLKSERRNR